MKPITRRTFLRETLQAAGAAAAVPAVARSAEATSALPEPCPPSAWTKHGIVLEPTESWEGGEIQNFTSPAEPIGEKEVWRLWYSARGKPFTIGYAEGRLGEPMKKVPATCTPGRPADTPLSIGNLPEKWHPTQVIHVPLKNGKHRIYFWAHGPGILRFLAADSDDGRRYRVVDPLRPVLYHPNDRAAAGVPSPDGVVLRREKSKDRPADEPLAPARLISNDATNLYQAPNGTFELYSVALVPVPKGDPAYVEFDNAPGLLRVVDRYLSDDGIRFEQRERIIQRDAKDPVDQQFYYLAVTYTPKGLVGMLGNYPCKAQTMDLEWCFSPDGKKWHRPNRTPWIARGEKGRPDSWGIYASHRLVWREGKWHLFYTGVNSSHNGKESDGPPRQVVMHATTDSIWA